MKKPFLILITSLAMASAAANAIPTKEVYAGDLHLSRDSTISKIVKIDELPQKHEQISNTDTKLLAALAQQKELKPINFALPNQQELTISKDAPFQLLLLNTIDGTQQTSVIDENIGKDLKRFERSDWYLYVKTESDAAYLKGYNAHTKQIISIVEMVDKFSMFTITHTGYLLTNSPEQIFSAQLMVRGDRILMNDQLKPVKMSKSPCVEGIVNIEVSHFANRLVIECG